MPQDPKLAIVKTATPTTYNAVDQVISYSYLLTNTGNVTLSGPFSVTDDKATDEACPATPASLAPGATVTCTASYIITQADLDAGSVTNIAAGHGFWAPPSRLGPGQRDGHRSADQVAVRWSRPPRQALTTRWVDIINYSYLVTNSGNVTLDGPFSVTDDKAEVTCTQPEDGKLCAEPGDDLHGDLHDHEDPPDAGRSPTRPRRPTAR